MGTGDALCDNSCLRIRIAELDSCKLFEYSSGGP